MTYELKFIPSALKDWAKLDNTVRQGFKKCLAKRLDTPCIKSALLRDLPLECYKIKLRKVGYRLIYTIEHEQLVVLVLIVARRDIVYKELSSRVKQHAL